MTHGKELQERYKKGQTNAAIIAISNLAIVTDKLLSGFQDVLSDEYKYFLDATFGLATAEEFNRLAAAAGIPEEQTTKLQDALAQAREAIENQQAEKEEGDD